MQPAVRSAAPDAFWYEINYIDNLNNDVAGGRLDGRHAGRVHVLSLQPRRQQADQDARRYR